jgi:hypothetical protein
MKVNRLNFSSFSSLRDELRNIGHPQWGAQFKGTQPTRRTDLRPKLLPADLSSEDVLTVLGWTREKTLRNSLTECDIHWLTFEVWERDLGEKELVSFQYISPNQN